MHMLYTLVVAPVNLFYATGLNPQSKTGLKSGPPLESSLAGIY